MSFSFDPIWDFNPLFGVKDLSTITTSPDFVVKIFPIWFKQVTLQWSIPAKWGNCTFNVYKGQTEEGPFYLLNNQEIHINFIKDVTTEAYSKQNRDWYVVEAVFPDGLTYIKSNAISWQNHRTHWVELRSKDIQRREWLLLRKFVGVSTMFFRRKNWGQRCVECWNEDTKRVMKDHCKTCLGTSFQDGYWPGIATLIQYEQTPSDISFEYFGKFEPNQIGAWTIAYPELDDLDIVVRLSDWKVYRIEKVVPTELQTVTVRQLMQITELGRNSVEYNLFVRTNATYFPADFDQNIELIGRGGSHSSGSGTLS